MPKRIMVVDDDPSLIKIATTLLVKQGYMVMPASSGADLMAKLPGFKPDAILLDVMMPGIDGVQVAENLAKVPGTSRIPIIFISALISPGQAPDSPTNPYHHYLAKPFELEALLAMLKRIGV